MALTIGESFARGPNNFDLMRLAAALLVLASHAYPLTGHTGAEPVARMLGGAADGGGLAVGAFFAISGFLVTRSALQRSPADFARARLLRIWPALALAVVVQTFVIGPLCTSLDWRDYLADPATYAALRTAFVVQLRPDLPGVFAANPVPHAVNGSLWTLRIECACYLALLGMARMGLLRRGRIAWLAAGAMVLMALAVAARAGLVAVPLAGPMLADPRIASALACSSDFMLGGLLWVYRADIRRSAAAVAAGIGCVLVARQTALAPAVLHAVLPYVVICAGLTRPLARRPLRALGDISYGVYLYAFPVQQAVLAWGPGPVGPWRLMLLALPPVLALAWLSSRLVEIPVLRLKSSKPLRPQPAHS